MSKIKLGFVGVGKMGEPMAGRLIDAGYDLVIHDTDLAATRRLTALGAAAADSPRSVADSAEIVIVSLPSPQILEQVSLGENGAIHGKAMRILIDISTTGVAVLLEGAADETQLLLARLESTRMLPFILEAPCLRQPMSVWFEPVHCQDIGSGVLIGARLRPGRTSSGFARRTR